LLLAPPLEGGLRDDGQLGQFDPGGRVVNEDLVATSRQPSGSRLVQ
jgi:hypothetical protein